jgi:hypothetical protein
MTVRSATAANADLGYAARGRSTNWRGLDQHVVVAAVVMLAPCVFLIAIGALWVRLPHAEPRK